MRLVFTSYSIFSFQKFYRTVIIKNALHGTTQEQRKKYFRNEQFMRQWMEGVNSLIRRLVEIEGMFKR